jgi:hypothetical protein
MSISTVVLDGARRAATYVTLLFSLNGPQPAIARPAAVQPAAASSAAVPLAIDGALAGSGLTLAAHHLAVRIAGGAASVQTLMLLRNDRPTQVTVQYLLPQPARVVLGDAGSALAPTHRSPRIDDDLSLRDAEQAEAAPGRLLQRHDVLVVGPGEQVVLQVQREVPVAAVGGVHRLQLPLPVDREAPWVPRFTADVLVEAGQPIRRLSSPTHQALVDGLGENSALLSVPDGFVYRQTELDIEFELGETEAGRPVAALDGAPAERNR